MNSLIETEFPLHLCQRPRYDLLDAITDSDLNYQLPGDNPPLGVLCRRNGELEHSYIQSFKTFNMDWSYRHPTPDLTIDQLRAWYRALDDEFEAVIRGFSEEDLHARQIDRGHGNLVSLFVQFQIYREALLIFFAHANVYLRALQKPMNEQWRVGIG